MRVANQLATMSLDVNRKMVQCDRKELRKSLDKEVLNQVSTNEGLEKNKCVRQDSQKANN